MRPRDIRRARRQAEAGVLRALYPPMTARQARQVLRHAHLVRTIGGETVASLLGR